MTFCGYVLCSLCLLCTLIALFCDAFSKYLSLVNLVVGLIDTPSYFRDELPLISQLNVYLYTNFVGCVMLFWWIISAIFPNTLLVKPWNIMPSPITFYSGIIQHLWTRLIRRRETPPLLRLTSMGLIWWTCFLFSRVWYLMFSCP